MKALQELVHLVTRYKRRQIEVLGYHEDPTSNYESFYDLIVDDKVRTDDEAAARMFGKDKTSQFDQYRRLKSDFFRRLVNSLFFIELKEPDFNDQMRASISCWKNLAAVKILMTKGARNAAISLAENTITYAQKYELLEIVFEMANTLKKYAATAAGDEKKWRQYDKLARECAEILAATARAEAMHEELVMPFVNSKSYKPWMKKKASEFMEELEPLVRKHGTFKLELYFRIIARLQKEIERDYYGVADICRKAIPYFDGNPAAQKTTTAIFSHAFVAALTMTEDYEEAESVSENALNYVVPGTTTWYKGREQHLVLKFYKRDYQGALSIFQEATKHKAFHLLPDMEQETWKIFEGNIQLLTLAGKIKPGAKAPTFKLQKYLNETPLFSRDKRGMNIPLLIMHTLFLLLLSRHEEAYDRMLALDKYADRHLKEGDDCFRSYCFIKALLQIQKAGFKRAESEAAAADWLHRMATQPVLLADAPHEVESIPYHHLWQIAMEAIDNMANGGGGGEQIADMEIRLSEETVPSGILV